MWDLDTGCCRFTLSQHSAAVWNLKFTPTKLISSSFDQSLLVWDFTACQDDESDDMDDYV